MRTFRIFNDDLVFDRTGNIEMVEGKEAETQAIERLLTTNTGEWFLNVEHGLEYNKIQGKGVTDEQIRLAFVKALSQDPNISSIEEIKIERDNFERAIMITIKCNMKSGNTIEVVKEFD